ncbi:hypothetical protein GJ496_006763 [Pomphorhynchus laevis]|nr:hypothetical protein GJ496_006763 [Pomphorhynchus laevis]
MAFLGRRLPTLFDRIKPNQHTVAHRAKKRQKCYHDQKSRPRSFVAQNLVWYCRNRGQRWEAAEIIKRTSANLYEIRTRDGRRVRTHVDQLRKRIDRCTELAQGDRNDVDVLPEWEYSALNANLQQCETRTDLSRRSNIISQTGDTSRTQSLTENTQEKSTEGSPQRDRNGFEETTNNESRFVVQPAIVRRSSRIRRRPQRYGEVLSW